MNPGCAPIASSRLSPEAEASALRPSMSTCTGNNLGKLSGRDVSARTARTGEPVLSSEPQRLARIERIFLPRPKSHFRPYKASMGLPLTS
jgi:hypothetical protein